MFKIMSVLAVSVVLFYTPISFAVSCNEESPSLKKLGEDYWRDTDRLVLDDNDPLVKRFDALQGRWSGSYRYSECIGGISHPSVRATQGTVEADISMTSDAFLALNLNTHDEQKKISRTQKETYLLKDSLFSLSLKEDVLSADERRRRTFKTSTSSSTNASLYEERMIEVEGHEQSISIRVVRYLNGVYADTMTLNLTR